MDDYCSPFDVVGEIGTYMKLQTPQSVHFFRTGITYYATRLDAYNYNAVNLDYIKQPIDYTIFAGCLQDTQCYWDPTLHRRTGNYGQTSYGGLRLYVDPTMMCIADADWLYEGSNGSAIISLLLHECVHAYLHQTRCEACACLLTNHYLDAAGETGHGDAWQLLAYDIERFTSFWTGIDFDLARDRAAQLLWQAEGKVLSPLLQRHCFDGQWLRPLVMGGERVLQIIELDG